MTVTVRQAAHARIARIQEVLREYDIPAWLFYGFHGIDPLALRILELPEGRVETRRWFYLVGRDGDPIALVHKIEKEVLDPLPGPRTLYAGWVELQERLREVLQRVPVVAMQYSPHNAIPYVSRVDAGTIELVRACGTEVISSADLVQVFEATWDDAQLATHHEAALHLRNLVSEAFRVVGQRARAGNAASELEVQCWFARRFEELDLETDHLPIVAVNEHSGNPHFNPNPEQNRLAKEGDFLLIDIWARKKQPNAVYADITWTGFVGETVPDAHRKIFEIVAAGRDAAIQFVQNSVAERRTMCGWQVDDVCRNAIRDSGYGDSFIHRTGHSIGRDVHWNGANIDNYETHDLRRILPRTCFSIEPGVYLPEFGVRSEVNVFVGSNYAEVTGGAPQREIVPILR